jgi:hypothetical protein
MPATKVRSKWVEGLLEFFGITAGTTVLKITESGIEGNLTGNVTGNVSGYALKSEARTATADGTGTGKISAGVTHVAVTAANAAHIITLPAPVPGLRIILQNGATGYELRSSAPATIAINGGAAENAESAVGAATTVIVECTSATTWIGSTVTAAGVVGVLEVAAP